MLRAACPCSVETLALRQHLKPPRWLPVSHHSLSQPGRLRGLFADRPAAPSTGAARWWRFVRMTSPSALGGHFEGVGVVWELKCQSAPCPSLSSRVDSWLNAGSSSPWDWEAKAGNPKIPVSPETPSWPAAGMHTEPLSTEWRPETHVLLKPLVSLRAFLPGIRPNCQYSIMLGSVSQKNAPGPHSSYFLQTECAWRPHFRDQSVRRKCVCC